LFGKKLLFNIKAENGLILDIYFLTSLSLLTYNEIVFITRFPLLHTWLLWYKWIQFLS